MIEAITSPVNRPPRPLLSRVAESAYWMSRYVERAEHVARVLTVNVNSLLDVGDLPEDVERQFWSGPLRIFLVGETAEAKELVGSAPRQMGSKIANYLVFDEKNPNSIYSCITRARENARLNVRAGPRPAGLRIETNASSFSAHRIATSGVSSELASSMSTTSSGTRLCAATLASASSRCRP